MNQNCLKEFGRSLGLRGLIQGRFIGATLLAVVAIGCSTVQVRQDDKAKPSTPVTAIKKGMTWGKVLHNSQFGIDRVGCYGTPRIDGTPTGSPCDPYQGDTPCSEALPILCIKPEKSPRPSYAVKGPGYAMPVEYYHGWTGGRIGLTSPIRGEELSSIQKANEACQSVFGPGYRMAEHHDGKYVMGMGEDNFFGETWPSQDQLAPGGWHWYAYGDVRGDMRFWVFIDDQPGNCWDSIPEKHESAP